MNGAQVHLGINHLPVVIPLIATAVLIAGLVLKSASVRSVALWLFVAAALAAIPVYFSGEPAEKVVKNYPGVSRLAIHRHEDAALIALIGSELVGLVSAFLLILSLRGKGPRRVFYLILLLLSFGSLGLMLNTAHLGGEIRHEEIQSEDILLQPNVPPTPPVTK